MINSNKQILIIEDSALQARILQDLLTEHRITSEVASTGSMALRKLEEQSFDLAIMDMVLPDTSGLRLIKDIKGNPKTSYLPIIIVSGVTDKENVVDALTLGISDYITKPYHHMELITRVNNHLNFIKAQNELNELNKTKDRLFAMLAHDIKNPLSNLMGLSEVLIKNPESTKQNFYIDAIYKSSKSIYDFFENIIMWVLAQSNSSNIYPESINIRDMADEVSSFWDFKAREKNITVINNVSPDQNVYGDYTMVNSIIRNLVSNAIKFTPQKGKVTISSQKATLNQDNMIAISVTDTGVGISPDTISTLTSSNNIMSKAGTEGEKGTGIGLTICREFTKRNKGFMEIKNNESGGTEVKVYLPAVA